MNARPRKGKFTSTGNVNQQASNSLNQNAAFLATTNSEDGNLLLVKKKNIIYYY